MRTTARVHFRLAKPIRIFGYALSGAVLAAPVLFAVGCRVAPADPSVATPAQPLPESAVAEVPVGPERRPQPPRSEPLAVNGAVRIVLTPLSHVAVAGGSPVLNLRIDAFGASGAPARMAGILRVVLSSPGADPERCAFDVPIETRSQETAHFDETLGQYVVRVAPAWMRIPGRGAPLEVALTLTVPDGPPLESTGTIAW
ncbi:MAG: hypothetical protein RI967_2358 [Planctomycetota bacterium]